MPTIRSRMCLRCERCQRENSPAFQRSQNKSGLRFFCSHRPVDGWKRTEPTILSWFAELSVPFSKDPKFNQKGDCHVHIDGSIIKAKRNRLDDERRTY